MNFNNFINDLSKLIAINSVETEATANAPFGAGPKKALDTFIEIAEGLGFKVTNYENRIAEITVGNGEEVGAIGHLDVVPVGTGWDTDPFTLTLKDGYFYGRGVEDDKGPTLACLYALKEVVDSGIKFNRTIKFYAGTNEETGWNDIEYFKENYGFPKYGFSPDGGFPATYAEKGMYQLDFYLPTLKNFKGIKGGTVINAVCSDCSVKPLINPDGYQKFGLTYDGERLYAKGVSAHGSTPHEGKNAILPLLEYFASAGEDVQNVIDCFFNDRHGISTLENEQGKTTLSPDLICEEGGFIKLSCDVRIPAPLTVYDVCDVACKFGYDFKVTEKHPPMLTDKNGWFVNSLVDAYNSVTGENKQASAIGGSTYARAFEQGCSVGGNLSKSNAHQPNERVSESDFKKMIEIYKNIFINLVK